MDIIGRHKLEKLKRKNLGNTLLSQAIDELIFDFENALFTTQKQLKEIRPDADWFITMVFTFSTYIFTE